MRRLLYCGAALPCLLLGSCISGALYQHTVEPLDVNLRDTPVGSMAGDVNRKDFNFQYIRIMWDGDDIAGAAKAAGMNEVFYADREVFSLLGIWRQDYVHVYGK